MHVRDGTPNGFEVLAAYPARWHPDDCHWYDQWEKGRTGQAVLGTYTRGGTVMTAGTINWPHGLRGDDPVVVRSPGTLDHPGEVTGRRRRTVPSDGVYGVAPNLTASTQVRLRPTS